MGEEPHTASILPEFYKKVAAEMQEEKTTLKSLQKSFDTIILEQWVLMHLDHLENGQYVPSGKGVYRRLGLGPVSTGLRNTLSVFVPYARTCAAAKRLLHLESMP